MDCQTTLEELYDDEIYIRVIIKGIGRNKYSGLIDAAVATIDSAVANASELIEDLKDPC